MPFSVGEARLCSWGSRCARSWRCIGCITLKIGSDDEVRPTGRANEQHAQEAMEAAKEAERKADVSQPPQAVEDDGAEAEAGLRHSWETNCLPARDWWKGLPWSAALRVGSPTFVQVPERFRGAVLAARHKALEVLTAACGRQDAAEEWKFFLLFDTLLLARPRTGGPTCAELLEERLAWWWGGQWQLLWASAVGGAAPPPPRARQTDKQRAARVHALAAAGEEGRALSAVRAGRPAPRTQATLDKLRECFPTAASPQTATAHAPVPPSADLRESVEDQVCRLLRSPPRLTAPGLLGSRLEHLAACCDDPDTLCLLAQVVARVAFGELPAEVLLALRAGELVGLEKGEDEVRPLVIGATIRRLGLRALARAKKDQLSEAAGDNQYGVGRPGGQDLLVKRLQAQAEVRPDAVFVKVDLKAAFQRMERRPAIEAMEAAAPEVAAALKAWYTGPSEHLWRDAAGRFETVTSTRGFDQGDPLAPAAFAIGQRQVLDRFLVDLKQLDPQARMYSYLDDTYLVASASAVVLALAGLREMLAPFGLDLNVRKTMVWSPSGMRAIPAELAQHAVPVLPVLGAHLRSRGDAAEAPEKLGGGSSLGEATDRLRGLWANLQRLRHAGLSAQGVGAFLRTYAGSASQLTL